MDDLGPLLPREGTLWKLTEPFFFLFLQLLTVEKQMAKYKGIYRKQLDFFFFFFEIKFQEIFLLEINFYRKFERSTVQNTPLL